ncbi:MAG: anti-sigma factor antagonist [Acutalibacteraceae bacterium]|nr:anti-sigma factor antagonist [Acutalibacteraceae bacterium]
MSVKISVKGEVVTAYLSGELDHHSAREMREAIDSAIELNIPELLVLDFSGIGFMDSSGIGLVMGRFRNLQRLGAQLHITGTSPQITKIMKLAGIERLAKLDMGGFKIENN